MIRTTWLPTATPDLTHSARAQACEAMLEQAFSLPGVREAMLVHGDWERRERALEPYREAIREYPVSTATDHANFDPPLRKGSTHAHME